MCDSYIYSHDNVVGFIAIGKLTTTNGITDLYSHETTSQFIIIYILQNKNNCTKY